MFLNVFNSPADDEWIDRINDDLMFLTTNQISKRYIKAKTKHDMLLYIPILITILAMYWSQDKECIPALAFAILVVFVFIILPQRKQCSLEINCIDEWRRK